MTESYHKLWNCKVPEIVYVIVPKSYLQKKNAGSYLYKIQVHFKVQNAKMETNRRFLFVSRYELHISIRDYLCNVRHFPLPLCSVLESTKVSMAGAEHETMRKKIGWYLEQWNAVSLRQILIQIWKERNIMGVISLNTLL